MLISQARWGGLLFALVAACGGGSGPGPAAGVDAGADDATSPEDTGPDAEESSDAVPVSVVFETPESRPESIMVEISDGTGGRQTFELQTASGTSVDELLELPPASVLPGRRGGA